MVSSASRVPLDLGFRTAQLLSRMLIRKRYRADGGGRRKVFSWLGVTPVQAGRPTVKR